MTTLPITRIESARRITAAVAVDTVPLLAARVQALLWWGRPITVVRRYLDSEHHPELSVGLHVDVDSYRPIEAWVNPDSAGFTVHLAPGISGFGFSAYAVSGNATEAEVWKRYYPADQVRRDLTIVELRGGGPGDGYPGVEELIVVRDWNEHGLGKETMIGFDSPAYSEVRQARESAGWQSGGESTAVSYCRGFVRVGRMRVRCSYPLDGGGCTSGDGHIRADAPVLSGKS
jgi:hypothetical protein